MIEIKRGFLGAIYFLTNLFCIQYAQSREANFQNKICLALFQEFKSKKNGTIFIEPQPEVEALINKKSYRLMQYNFFHLINYEGLLQPDVSLLSTSYLNRGGLFNFYFVSNKERKFLKREEKRLMEQGKLILEIDPDFLVGEELRSFESTKAFVSKYLNNRYDVVMTEGNDPRGIKIGLIVRKGLDIKIESLSHSHLLWMDSINQKVRVIFDRDFPIWIIRDAKTNKILTVLSGEHDKSQRDREGDPSSNRLRTHQIKTGTLLLQKVVGELNYRGPVFRLGDFNTDVRYSEDVSSLHEDFVDSLDVAPEPTIESERITHTYHPEKKPYQYQWSQLDGIFVSKNHKRYILSSNIYRYKDSHGYARWIPTSIKARDLNPSDHFPIYADIAAHFDE